MLQHGVIVNSTQDVFGYYGWGTLARLDAATLAFVCSGHRLYHICPFGKTLLFISKDEGLTWSRPILVNDTYMDDRDAGLLNLGKGRLLLSWFSNSYHYIEAYDQRLRSRLSSAEYDLIQDYTALISSRKDDWGSFLRLSKDGGLTWSEKIQVAVTAPHGPILKQDGSILYLGKGINSPAGKRILAYESTDSGETWSCLGGPELPQAASWDHFFEPHALELPSGKIIGMLRYQESDTAADEKQYGSFTLFQTDSYDGGKTWSVPICLDTAGAPPHLLRHSSGVLVCVYGHREEPYGERAMLSCDDGETWLKEYILFTGAPDGDLGYPSSVERQDGSILTAYYQKQAAGEKCALLYTIWTLDDFEIFDLLDEQRGFLHKKQFRGLPLPAGVYHQVVEIWTINNQKQILLTLRSLQKKEYGGFWENTAGAARSGENARQAARRELQEETGIRVQPEELHFLGSHKEESCFMDSFLVRKDISLQEIILQPGETEQVKWVTLQELDLLIANGELAAPVVLRLQPLRQQIETALRIPR